MKSIYLVLALILAANAYSQSKKDTTTILYNSNWQPNKVGTPAYVGLAWKEGNKWHKQDYYYPESILEKDGIYLDKEFKIKDGIFTWYHPNGMMEDSCLFINNNREGTQVSWNEEGTQVFSGHWHNNLPVDTSVWWNKNGIITAYRITDSMGNGLYQSFLKDGKTEKIKGRLVAGARSGKWIFKDENGIMAMEADYDKDSVIAAKCYNEKGEAETGKKDCVVEQKAGYKGGINAFRKYLEKNLEYPIDAQKAGIQGVVSIKFTILKDGSVADVNVLKSPHPSLSKEAVRIIQNAPGWEPAIQYNRKVNYLQIQGVTFSLE